MKEINEIIVSIKKGDEKKENVKEIKIKKREIPLDEELNDWIISLKEKLYKRNYKKAIKAITSAGLISRFKAIPRGYKILSIFIQAKLKVIENKIFKYHLNSIDTMKHKSQITKCFSYANNIQYEMEILIEYISTNNNLFDNDYYNNVDKRNYKIELFDEIIRCHFEYIYTMSLLHYKIGNFTEAVSLLSLFLTLYKKTIQFTLSTHTLYKISKCFLLLAKIYMANEDYKNALGFLKESGIISFKQILFQVEDIYQGVFIGEDEKDLTVINREHLRYLRDSRVKRAIINIVLLFLYQGICNENLSDIKKATSFYKQCEWFSRIFLLKKDRIFYKLFFNLKRNAIDTSNNIDYLKGKIVIYEEKLLKKRNAEEEKEKDKKYSKRSSNLYNTTKFKGLVKKLQGMKILEIDTDNKFERKRNIKSLSSGRREGTYKKMYLSNIRLLEAYLRKDFRNIVNNMDKINLFDLEYKTREKIQKTLHKIYFEENQKSIRNKNKSTKTVIKRNSKINIIREEADGRSKVGDRTSSSFQSEQNLGLNKKRVSLNLFKYKFKNNNLHFLDNIIENKNDINKNNHENKKENKKENTYENNKICLSNKERTNPTISPKVCHSTSSYHIFNSSTPTNLYKKIRSNSIEIRIKDSPLIEKKIENQKKSGRRASLIKSQLKKKKKYRIIPPEACTLNEFFSFKYFKKRDYIKKLADRDLLFQKSILKSKNIPLISFQHYNKVLVQKNANDSFQKIESLVSSRFFSNDWKDNFTEEEFKEYLTKNKLENALISSLDNKALLNYKLNLRKAEEKEEKKDLLDDSDRYNKKFLNINEDNKKTLEEINLKLNHIYEKELKKKQEDTERNKNIFKKFCRNRSNFSRSRIGDLPKNLLGYHSFQELPRLYIQKNLS